jgi:hypothetical protein
MYGVGRFRSTAKMLPLGVLDGSVNTGTFCAIDAAVPTEKIGAGPAGLYATPGQKVQL